MTIEIDFKKLKNVVKRAIKLFELYVEWETIRHHESLLFDNVYVDNLFPEGLCTEVKIVIEENNTYLIFIFHDTTIADKPELAKRLVNTLKLNDLWSISDKNGLLTLKVKLTVNQLDLIFVEKGSYVGTEQEWLNSFKSIK